MRTNTWLGLIWLNQMTQVLQADNIAREQQERDKARDELFAKAHEEATRGRFAMWIQTPDGQLFERWSEHALLASRAIDDREAAWDLAWAQDLQARREAVRPVAAADAESKVVRVPSDQVRRARLRAIIATVAAALCMIAWLTLVIVAPVSGDGEPAVTPASVIAFFLMLFLVSIATWEFWRANAKNRRAKDVAQHVDNFISTNVLPNSISWHRRANSQRLRDVEAMIAEVVDNAAASYPRKESLVQLSGTYDTRQELPHGEHEPEVVQQLLAAFRDEDRERKAALQRDGVA